MNDDGNGGRKRVGSSCSDGGEMTMAIFYRLLLIRSKQAKNEKRIACCAAADLYIDDLPHCIARFSFLILAIRVRAITLLGEISMCALLSADKQSAFFSFFHPRTLVPVAIVSSSSIFIERIPSPMLNDDYAYTWSLIIQ